MQKIIILILLMFSLLTTNGQKKIAGLYGKCEKQFFACLQIQLNQDSTFDYYLFLDVGGWQFRHGIWKTNGDTVILNTFDQPPEPINKMSYNSAIKGFLLKLAIDSSITDKIIINVNDNEFIDTLSNNQSMLIDKKYAVSKLKILNYYAPEIGIVLFCDSKINVFEVKALIADTYDPTCCMTNEKWLLRKNKLYNCSQNNNDSKGEYLYYLEKTNKRNKILKEVKE